MWMTAGRRPAGDSATPGVTPGAPSGPVGLLLHRRFPVFAVLANRILLTHGRPGAAGRAIGRGWRATFRQVRGLLTVRPIRTGAATAAAALRRHGAGPGRRLLACRRALARAVIVLG